MSNRRSKNKTKDLICLALYALMLREDYDNISVKDICAKAGVSRMSFYRYYTMKDDVFVTYCDERFEEFYASISDIKDLDTSAFTLKVFEFIDKYKRQIKVLFAAHRESLLLDQLNSYCRYLVSNLKSDLFIEQKNNPVFAFFMAGGLFNVIVYWVNSPHPVSPQEINEMLHSITTKKEI